MASDYREIVNRIKEKCNSFVLEKKYCQDIPRLRCGLPLSHLSVSTELECNVNTSLRRYRLDSRPVTIKRNKNDLEIFLLLFTSFSADVLAVHSH